MGTTRICVVTVALLAFARAGAAEGMPGGEGPQHVYPNVIVPHASESAPRQAEPRAADRVAADAIELLDVEVVVAVPESAQQGMIPVEKQSTERAVVGVSPDGRLVRKATGPFTAYYGAEDGHILIEGVDEQFESAGETAKRPLLIVRRWAEDGTMSGRERFHLAIKTVKPEQSGIEADMEIRGGVKALDKGVKVGTIDVYLEIELPGEDGRQALVRGTFEESAIPGPGGKSRPNAEAASAG